MYLSAFVLIVGTGAYSVVGGLNAVIWTELYQTVTLVIGKKLLDSGCNCDRWTNINVNRFLECRRHARSKKRLQRSRVFLLSITPSY